MTIEEKVGDFTRINWPQTTGIYKVVQFISEGRQCLRFHEESETVNHVDIMRSLVEDLRKLHPQAWNDSNRVPALKSEFYEVVGMGHAAVDAERKKAFFFGSSVGYEIEISKEHLRDIRLTEPNWGINYKQ